MKIKAMKLLLASAMSLAVAVSFMSSSVPVQAAGPAGNSPSTTHVPVGTWTGNYDFDYEESNSEYHCVYGITETAKAGKVV